MQPEPIGSSVRLSNCGSTVLQGELSQKLKRKACGDDSRKKFLKVSADFIASSQAAIHRLDVSDTSSVITAVNGFTPDPTPNAFNHGTVKDEKIYLDLKDGQMTQDLERYITRFGGIVEKFLSKDITCVVTSHINPSDMRAEDAILRKDSLSPISAEKPKPDICSSLRVMSRGKALLLRSNSIKASSAVCGPVQFARTWKIPVVEVSVLRKLLKKENDHRKQVSSQSSKLNAKKLGTPFVKVEDTLHMYSTNFRLFNAFPMPYLSSLDSLACNGASQSNESSVKKKTKQKRIKKSGYCECCDVSFTDQKEHLNSRMHKAFVMRNENFASLDALVSKLPSLEKFALGMELDAKNFSSFGSVTGSDPKLVHGLSYSHAPDRSLNPSYAHDVAVHKTKHLRPSSITDLKLDAGNLCDAKHVKSNSGVLPGTCFAPNGSGSIRKSRTKRSQKTSSKSFASNSDSFHRYEKCVDGRNLVKASDRYVGKSVNKNNQMIRKGSHSDLNVDSNCPVDLSMPKSSTGVSLHQSPVSCLSTVSEFNFAKARISKKKISEVSNVLKTDEEASQRKLATCNYSDNAPDISDPKETRDKLIPERMDISLDVKLLAAPAVGNNAELRSPFLGSTNVASKEASKDDDLDFSSDEVSDSADEKVDWRINLRNSCNKVLNILEDSNSSKDMAKDLPDSSDKKEFKLSNCKNLKMLGGGQPAFRIQSGLDSAVKAIAVKVSEKETAMSCATKHGGVGIVRPWEMVSNKPEPIGDQLRTDKEGRCKVERHVLGAGDCALQTNSDLCPDSIIVYRRINSPANCIAAKMFGKTPLPEASHSDDYRDPQTTTHLTDGSNTNVTNLNEFSNSEITYSTEASISEKTPSAEVTAVKIDICTVESAVLTVASSHVPEKRLHSPPPVKVCIAEQSVETLTDEIMPAVIAESPTRFQDSPHNSSQSSVIVDVEACDEGGDNSEEKSVSHMPCYEVITPVKSSSLEIGDRCIAFGSNYEVFDKRALGQLPSWPITPVLVNGQVIYLPASAVGIPTSPAISEQLFGRGLTNGHTVTDFMSGVSCELQMHKQDSACSSLDSGFCASIKTVTIDSYPASPVENCARSIEKGETGICEPKCIPDHTENPVSSPVSIPAETSNSLPTSTEADKRDTVTAAFIVSSIISSQCKTTDSVPLNSQSDCPPSTVLSVTPITSNSIPVPLQTDTPDEGNLQLQTECACSPATHVQSQSSSSVSIQAANNDTLPVLSQTENHNLLLVSDQRRYHVCAQFLDQAESSKSLPVPIQVENTGPHATQEEKSDSFVTLSNTENHSCTQGVDKHQISDVDVDETECKDMVQPAIPMNQDEKVDALEDLACTTVQVQGREKVPEVQIYPDLMSGINELAEKAKRQMPDLLMETKNGTALDSPFSSTSSSVSTHIHLTASESVPQESISAGSDPMDVGFGELSEDFFTARSNPITFYEIDKNEEVPWIDHAWGPANHAVDTSATVDTWPEELATIVPSSCSNDLSPSLNSLMMSAPIGTPNCVRFSDDDICIPAAKEVGVLCGPPSEIRLANSVNSVAEPAVLDDDVLTALSRILEDASKEWQAERQKSSATDYETVVCPSVCVSDKELKQSPYNKISDRRASSVEIPTSPMMQVPKPVIQIEHQSAENDEEKKVNFSEAVCSDPQRNLTENGSLCIDAAQEDNGPVSQALQLCINDAKKELDETSKTESVSGTVCTPIGAPVGDLDDLDKLMQMLKALNEEAGCDDETRLISSCNTAATNSCQTLKKDNSPKLVNLPNKFCDSFGSISFAKTHKTLKHIAAGGNSVCQYSDSSTISTNNFSSDISERAACQFEERNREVRCKWKMTYISGLKYIFQRLLHSPEQSHCAGKYSIKTLGSERLALRISKNKSKFKVKS